MTAARARISGGSRRRNLLIESLEGRRLLAGDFSFTPIPDGVTDVYRIALNGTTLEVRDEVADFLLAAADVTIFDNFIFNGSTDAEQVTVDLSGGFITNPIVLLQSGPSASPGDSVVVSGAVAEDVTLEMTASDAGIFRIDSGGAAMSQVTFSGAERVEDQLIAGTRLFEFGAAANLIVFSDDGNPNDGVNQFAADGAAPVRFNNPTAAINVVTAGGDDTIELNQLDSLTTVDMTVDGGNGDDTFVVNGLRAGRTVNLIGGVGSDTFTIGNNAAGVANVLGDVNVDGGSNAATDVQTASIEAITLVNSKSISVAVGDQLFIDNTGDGAGAIFTVNQSRISGPSIAAFSVAGIETTVMQTGSGDDAITVLGTPDDSILVVETGDGVDSLVVRDTGERSLLRASMGGEFDAIAVAGTGADSFALLSTDDGEGRVTINGTGSNSAAQVTTGDLSDVVTIGGVGDSAIMRIETGDGDDRVNARATAVGSETNVVLGRGNDTVVVRSSANRVDEILGDLQFVGMADTGTNEVFEVSANGLTVSTPIRRGDRLVIDDSGSNLDVDSHRLDATSYTGPMSGRVLYATVESIELFTGTTADIVTVVDTPVSSLVSIDTNAGMDQLVVRSTGIRSVLQANTGDDGDTVQIATTGNRSVVLVDAQSGLNRVNINGSGFVSGIDIIGGGDVDSVRVAGTGDRSATRIDAGDGNDTITIQRTAIGSETEVQLGGGDDIAILRSTGDTIDTIDGNVAIDGGENAIGEVIRRAVSASGVTVELELPRGDQLVVDNSGRTTNSNISVDATSIATVGVGDITFESVETLDLSTGTGVDTVTIEGTANATTMFLDTSAGNDRIVVRNTGEQSILQIDTLAGNDRVDVDATGTGSVTQLFTDAGVDRVTVAGTGVGSGFLAQTGDAGDFVTIRGVGEDSVNLLGTQAGVDRVTLESTAPNSRTQVDLGDGDDLAVLRDPMNQLAFLLGAIEVNGQESSDQLLASPPLGAGTSVVGPRTLSGDRLVVDDSGSAADSDFIINSASITASGTLAVAYDSIEKIEILSGSGADVFEIHSTVNQTSLAIDTGEGDDELTVNGTGDESALVVSMDAGIDRVTINSTGIGSGVGVQTGDDDDEVLIAGTGVDSVQAISTGDGNDQLAIQVTAEGSDGEYDLGGGQDLAELGTGGVIDGIRGTIVIDAGTGDPGMAPRIDNESVVARRSPSETASLASSVSIDDRIVLEDSASTIAADYQLTAESYVKTSVTGLITYRNFEDIEASLGSGSDTVGITGTTAAALFTLRTNAGSDTVTIDTTGADSISRIQTGLLSTMTGSDDDTIAVRSTGRGSVLAIDTSAGGLGVDTSGVSSDADTIRVDGRGVRSAIGITTGAADLADKDLDNVTIGAATEIPQPGSTDQSSLIAVTTGASDDVFTVNEVFIDTIVDLRGDDGNDRFEVIAANSNASGILRRLNDGPSRELIVDGGANVASRVRAVSEGILLSSENAASFGSVGGLQVGDVVRVNATAVTASLDLRFAITAFAQGLLGTTPPSTDPDGRATAADEVLESTGIENVVLASGQADDVLTVTSNVVFGIHQTGQVLGFDGNGGEDRIEILGTAGSDRITVGPFSPAAGPATRSPFEIRGVEFVRADGNLGNDQIANRTDALSVLDGNEGSDRLSGGNRADLIAGGAGVDFLYGNLGNDFLRSDVDQDSEVDQFASGEHLDGGGQDNLVPGDLCIQVGVDRVLNCETITNGGAEFDVLTWLRARVIPAGSFSTLPGSSDVSAFAPIRSEPPVLTSDREPNDLNAVALALAFADLNSDSPGAMTNHHAMDVSGDGNVTALDALQVINRINRVGTGEPLFKGAGQTDPYDINGDGRVSSLDALLIINRINQQETIHDPPKSTTPWYTAVDDWFSLEEERRREYAEEVLQLEIPAIDG